MQHSGQMDAKKQVTYSLAPLDGQADQIFQYKQTCDATGKRQCVSSARASSSPVHDRAADGNIEAEIIHCNADYDDH